MRSDGEKLISFQVNARFLADVDKLLDKLPEYRGNRTAFIKAAIFEKLERSVYLTEQQKEGLRSLASAPARTGKGGRKKPRGAVLRPEQMNDMDRGQNNL